MALNDAMVGACVPLVVGFGVWIAKQFIHQEVERGPRGDPGPPGEPGLGMSVRNFKEFADFLIQQLNGRYLLAEEFRLRHSQLEMKVDDMRDKLGIIEVTQRGQVQREGGS